MWIPGCGRWHQASSSAHHHTFCLKEVYLTSSWKEKNSGEAVDKQKRKPASRCGRLGELCKAEKNRFSFSAAGEPFSGRCDVGQFGPHCWVDAVILGSINQALCRQSICLTISGGTGFNYCTKRFFVFFFNIEINIAILIWNQLICWINFLFIVFVL